VTGAHGLLGRTLLGLDDGVEWVASGRSQRPVEGAAYWVLDITDGAAVAETVARVRPDWIINTAALTDVDRCEQDETAARRVNAEAVGVLAEAAARQGAGVVQLSTDYVFDGTAGPYAESDPPRPLSAYGRTKLASERALLERLERAIVVRTLWLYGYEPGARPNFVTWVLDALHSGRTIRVFEDQWGNPTAASDLARVLLSLCRAEARGVYHMGGATYLTRYELALELARLFGLSPAAVQPVATQSAGLRAPRPLRSGLRTDTLCRRLRTRPLSFADGVAEMRGQAAFRRDFAHLL